MAEKKEKESMLAGVLQAVLERDPGETEARHRALADFHAAFARTVEPGDKKVLQTLLAHDRDAGVLVDRAFDLYKRITERHYNTHSAIEKVNDAAGPEEALQRRRQLLTELLAALQQAARETVDLLTAMPGVIQSDARWETVVKMRALTIFINFFFPPALDPTPKRSIDLVNKHKTYFSLRRNAAGIVPIEIPNMDIEHVARSTASISKAKRGKADEEGGESRPAKRQRTGGVASDAPSPAGFGTVTASPASSPAPAAALTRVAAPPQPVVASPAPGGSPAAVAGAPRVLARPTGAPEAPPVSSMPAAEPPAALVAARAERAAEKEKEEDFNDVLAGSGVNPEEESQRLLEALPAARATGVRHAQAPFVPFVDDEMLRERIDRIVYRVGLREGSRKEVRVCVSEALRAYLKNLLEKVRLISEHRSDMLTSKFEVEYTTEVLKQVQMLRTKIAEFSKFEIELEKKKESAAAEAAAGGGGKKTKKEKHERMVMEVDPANKARDNLSTVVKGLGRRNPQKVVGQPDAHKDPTRNIGNAGVQGRSRQKLSPKDLLFLLEQDPEFAMRLSQLRIQWLSMSRQEKTSTV